MKSLRKAVDKIVQNQTTTIAEEAGTSLLSPPVSLQHPNQIFTLTLTLIKLHLP